MSAVLWAALVIALGGIVMAVGVRPAWGWRRPAQSAAHYEQTVEHLHQIRHKLEGTKARADGRATRLAPSDDERVGRLAQDAAVRGRDHSP